MEQVQSWSYLLMTNVTGNLLQFGLPIVGALDRNVAEAATEDGQSTVTLNGSSKKKQLLYRGLLEEKGFGQEKSYSLSPWTALAVINVTGEPFIGKMALQQPFQKVTPLVFASHQGYPPFRYW